MTIGDLEIVDVIGARGSENERVEFAGMKKNVTELDEMRVGLYALLREVAPENAVRIDAQIKIKHRAEQQSAQAKQQQEAFDEYVHIPLHQNWK